MVTNHGQQVQESVAVKGNRGKEIKVFGLLKMGNTWVYLNDERNDSVEMEKLK